MKMLILNAYTRSKCNGSAARSRSVRATTAAVVCAPADRFRVGGAVT